ncbi:AAA domain-containing protein [Actinokineospora sp. PR83]|uniref:AAA domain-containing protein n=1 Tax=Actinokineospora sp. PR83 TaxID=2884908 RepID=UPI001F2C3013|nr:AAA domain-containing protein [Actinokineospora sp. PR83]MCG8918132.1 AAA domain-containing protein [Actinokineospora sp. PR83]
MTTRLPHPIGDLVTALNLEIAAVLANDGKDNGKIPLRDGQVVSAHGTGIDYVFSATNWREQSNNRFLARPSSSRGAWVQVTATAMPGGKVRVTAESDLGRNLTNVQLRADDTASLELLVERIAASGEDAGFNSTTASWVLGEGSPRIGRCPEPGRLVHGYDNLPLNNRQRLAIEHALASDITFIWGPPGTGKTDVISRIIEGCYRQGLRVLFVAPTHVAVDQALERVCELLVHEEQFRSGLVQRSGEIEVPTLAQRYGDAVSPDAIADRLTAELAQRIQSLQHHLGEVREGIALHREIAHATAERSELLDSARALEDAIGRHHKQARSARDAADKAQLDLDQIGDDPGLFGRKQKKIDSLRARVADRAAEAQRAHDLVQADEARLRECRRRLDTIAGRLTTETYHRLQTMPTLPRLDAQERELTGALADAEKERRSIVTAVRERCRVMGATVAKAVQSNALMSSTDVVVIDEAGMVALPSAWYAAGLGAKRVVIAGDFRQLPPVTLGATNTKASEADRAHSRRWMDRDPFHAAALVDEAGSARPDARMICLDAQYRMRPDICAAVNTVAYPDSPLRTLRDNSSRVPPSPLLPAPVVLVDTSSRRVPHPRGRRDAHMTNPVHEAVIHELIRGLQYDGVLPGRKAEAVEKRATDRLAVITPYRLQARALDTSLRYRFGERFDGLVDTVHRFQGSQRPVVVIDTVAGAGDKLGFFYGGTGLSSTTCRLLNVALSRAQDHLVVVADVDFLKRNLPPGSEAARLVEHLERHAHRLSIDDLVPVRTAADLAGLTEEELARPSFFPADEVHRAVEWDIDHAGRSLEIYCPFLDPRPVRRWLRILAPRLAAGVRVVVHTRPPDGDSAEGKLVDELRGAGCEVSLRERMHEKVMIVDDTVLWHGSLNLLANTGPTDLMMRITDAAACERVRKIMTTARRERPLADPAYRRGPGGSATTGSKIRPGEVDDGRLYLDVPFADNAVVKREFNARFDRAAKLWHVDAAVERSRIHKWLPTSTDQGS